MLSIEEGMRQHLYRPSHLIIMWRDPQRSEGDGALDEGSRMVFRQALLDWLCRAQDATGIVGVAGDYSFSHGWSAAYPETTCYIIPAFLEAARRCKMSEYEERARRMADWEVSIQLADGFWQSGFVTAPKVPAVFIMKTEAGGNSPIGTCLIPNFTRVAWPLLALATVTGEVSYRHSAVRFLEWAARCPHDTGWFEHCALEPNEPPLLHTIGYTIEGFLESGLLLKEDRWITVGQCAADALLHRYEVCRCLAGTYAEGWKGDRSFSCLTGCARISPNLEPIVRNYPRHPRPQYSAEVE